MSNIFLKRVYEPYEEMEVRQIFEIASSERVTLLYGVKDPIYNHAQVLMDELTGLMEVDL